MTDAALALEHVTKRYAGHVAVADLTLTVPRGALFGLLGPNGAGKTTTIRMINDIVRPDEGRVTLFGSLAPGRAALGRIGYLPEERGLYAKMTVRRVLCFLGELRGLPRADLGPRIATWLARLELTAWADRKVEALSKGMQQKVQFIATLLHDPELLILDEPFGGLDPINADVLRAIVLEQKAAGKTIVFSTHLMEHAEQMCDAIAIIAGGRKILDGDLRAIKRAEQQARNEVLVELARMPEGGAVPPWLAPDPATGVTASRYADGAFTVTLAPGAHPAPLLRKLLDAGEEPVRFERAAPTLHRIFVEHTRSAAAEPT